MFIDVNYVINLHCTGIRNLNPHTVGCQPDLAPEFTVLQYAPVVHGQLDCTLADEG
jgi:hypothetical protein